MTRARLRIVTRLGSPRAPYSSFLFGSFLVHTAIAVALIIYPSLHKRPQLYSNPVIVELAAPASPKPTPPAAPAQPAPQPEVPAEGVRAAAQEPKIVEKPKEKPKEKPSKPPEKKPEPVKPAPAPQESADAGPGGAPGTAEVGDAGASVAPMEGGDLAFAWYRASVTAALYGHWQRPILSGLTEPLEVRVGFDILRDGTVRDIRIEQSSGVPSLDRSAQRAVADAAPLPPLPSNWREPVLPAGFVFRLFPGDY